MNNSILRAKHNASFNTISVLQNLMKRNRLEYVVGFEEVLINEITGIRAYNRNQRVKTYDTMDAIEALENYLEDLEEENKVTSRNVKKKAIEALELMYSIV